MSNSTNRPAVLTYYPQVSGKRDCRRRQRPSRFAKLVDINCPFYAPSTDSLVLRVELTPGETIPGDRLYAIENGLSGFNPAAPAYLSKTQLITRVTAASSTLI